MKYAVYRNFRIGREDERVEVFRDEADAIAYCDLLNHCCPEHRHYVEPVWTD